MKEQEITAENDAPEAQEAVNAEKHDEGGASRKESRKEKKEKSRIEALEKQVSELTDKIAKEKDDYVRLMAEFDNFRRRTSQEKLDLVSVAAEETIKGLLPVLDDCERALDVLSKSDDRQSAKEGT